VAATTFGRSYSNFAEAAMYTIEFEADIQNGIVKIPDDYRTLKDQHVRVVILIDEDKDERELRAYSEHSAGLLDEWLEPAEDDIWK
jgi:hypothetical protein